ncbi:MAG TPA: carboxypeptidase-like regulatory domain-containing protein [Thermoanaerobaculia bacterium]|nr:carboxypeptidase-like regulatory domain-containing protein [Thermoanaerobaculia bacterium]
MKLLARTLLASGIFAACNWTAAAQSVPSVTGIVAAADGAPLTGALVSLVPMQSSYDWGRMVLAGRAYPEASVSARSDTAGRYRLAPPSGGLWLVVVEAPGHVPLQSPPLALLDPVDLPPAIPPQDSGARLEAGTPGVWVYASTETASLWQITETAGWNVRPRFGVTGPDGALTLPRAAGERLKVTLLAPGGKRVEKGGFEGGAIPLPETPAASRTLEVRAADGRPASGVQVRLENFPVPLGETDEQGRIALKARGSLRIRLLAPDGRRRNASVGDPGEASAVVRLPAAVSLPGRVLSSSTRRPVAGALVWAAADPGAFSRTDSLGRYRVVPIEGERPRVQTEAAGHLPLVHRLDWRPGAPFRAPTLALDPAAAVGGQVVDAKGAPAPGVLVQAVQRSGTRQRQFSRTGVAERSTSSGADGRFRLDRLLAGEAWEIRALRPGFAAARVTLPALRSRSDLRLVLEKGRNGFGRVVDRADKPVLDAEVVLLSSTGEQSLLSERRSPGEEGIDSWRAATNTSGRFEVPALPPGTLDLLVRKSGFAPVLVRAVPVPRGEGPLDLGTVILEPGAEIRGRVTGRDGKPVAGAEVHATRDARRVRLAAENGTLQRKPEAVTDAEGHFKVPDLRRGDRLDLWVQARGFLPGEVEGVPAPTPPNTKTVAVVLDPAARVAGRAVDGEGLPVAGAELSLSTERTGEERGLIRQAGRSEGAAVSDEDGRFTFEGVRPGRAEIRASAAGLQPAVLKDLEVSAKGLDNVKVVMERGAVVEGRVLTSAGDPVGDARVTCGSAASVSDADGVYRLEGVTLGRQTVRGHHQDFPPVERKIEVDPVSNQLDLVFQAGNEVSGRVVDRDGKGIEGARVSLYQEDNPRERDTLTAADGSFVLAHVADAQWSVRAEMEGHATAELPGAVRMAGAPIRDLEVRLSRGGKIAGRLLGLEMYDLAEVTVRAKREGGQERPGKVDYSGSYEVAGLAPGDWVIQGTLRNGAREAQARAVLEPEGDETGVDLEFGVDLTVSGRVLLGGEPLRGARVSLAGQDVAVNRMVESDWEGLFRLEDVQPGRYRLQVTSSRDMASHSEDLALESDRELLIELGATRFSGTVVDESTSDGIEGAIVALRRLEGEEAAFLMTMGTDGEGYFVLPNVTEGRYRVTVTKDGYSPWEQVIQVYARAPLQDQRIPLAPTRGLEIAPALASGRKPPHVTAALRDGSGRILLFEMRPLDGTGIVRFPTAPPGEWELLVSAPGAALREARVKVPGDRVPVVLADAARLTVRVPQLATSDAVALLTLLDAQGRPFRNLSPYGTVQNQWQVVGGKAVVEGVPAGAWTLRAVAPDGRTWAGTVVTGAADAEVNLN